MRASDCHVSESRVSHANKHVHLNKLQSNQSPVLPWEACFWQVSHASLLLAQCPAGFRISGFSGNDRPVGAKTCSCPNEASPFTDSIDANRGALRAKIKTLDRPCQSV